MRDMVEIYGHSQARQSLTTVARSVKVDRKTVRKYVKVAMEAGITCDRVLTREQWMAFVRERFPEVAGGPSRTPWRAHLEPYAARIREGLASEPHGYGMAAAQAGYRAWHQRGHLQAYVHAVMPEAIGRVTVTVWRPEVAPGEEVQLDFGRMGY
jgi:hypothetical protein